MGDIIFRPLSFYFRGNNSRYLLGLGGPQSQSGRYGEEKNLNPAEDQTPAVQSAARHYSDWATPAVNTKRERTGAKKTLILNKIAVLRKIYFMITFSICHTKSNLSQAMLCHTPVLLLLDCLQLPPTSAPNNWVIREPNIQGDNQWNSLNNRYIYKKKKVKNFYGRRNEEVLDWPLFSASQSSVYVAGWH
jgi:hypothetical protein